MRVKRHYPTRLFQNWGASRVPVSQKRRSCLSLPSCKTRSLERWVSRQQQVITPPQGFAKGNPFFGSFKDQNTGNTARVSQSRRLAHPQCFSRRGTSFGLRQLTTSELARHALTIIRQCRRDSDPEFEHLSYSATQRGPRVCFQLAAGRSNFFYSPRPFPAPRPLPTPRRTQYGMPCCRRRSDAGASGMMPDRRGTQ